MRDRTDSTVDILMVDDREDGLVALEALLQNQENYNLVKAQSGAEALSLLAQYDFAVILLDVQMPILDGFQTAELIRRHPRFRSVPIVFVTAINKDERYVLRGFEVGAVDYIFKPFEPVILRSKVAIFAELHLKSRKIRRQAMQLAEREVLSQRAKVQEMELESLRRYRSLADAIPHIILRANAPDSLDYHNALWSHSTGMSAGETVGAGWQRAIDPRDLPSLLMAWSQAINEKRNFEAEVRIRMREGTVRWHWFKGEPETDATGKTAWLSTATDIHERKSIEQDLVEARRNADAANEAKTHFLANMSHEIRTPLSAIMGFSELLLDSRIQESGKVESAAIIRRNGVQLLRIVDEILDISKVEAGGLEIEHTETLLIDLLGEIKTLMQAEAGKRNLEFAFEIETSLPERVITDPTRLRQILLNVIGNAIKFTETGWVKASGRAFPSEGGWLVQFEITDTGTGIDPASAEKIFEAFSQADSSTTRLYGGTGLGLALSRRLARAMGGDVRLVHSQPASGSLFEIKIRADSVSNSVEFNVNDENANGILDRAGELKGRKILLVEDAPDNQALISSFLSPSGVALDVADNGHEGVKKALGGDYEAVLMDIQMPLMDGYQATARLRQAGYTRPIIALTAYALPEEREKSLSKGCTAHLSKPISRKTLLEGLLKVIKLPKPPNPHQIDA